MTASDGTAPLTPVEQAGRRLPPPPPDLHGLAVAVTRRRWNAFVVVATLLVAAVVPASLVVDRYTGSGDTLTPERPVARYEFTPVESGGVAVVRTWTLTDGSNGAHLDVDLSLANRTAAETRPRVREQLPEPAGTERIECRPVADSLMAPSDVVEWAPTLPAGATVAIHCSAPISTGDLDAEEALSRWAATTAGGASTGTQAPSS